MWTFQSNTLRQFSVSLFIYLFIFLRTTGSKPRKKKLQWNYMGDRNTPKVIKKTCATSKEGRWRSSPVAVSSHPSIRTPISLTVHMRDPDRLIQLEQSSDPTHQTPPNGWPKRTRGKTLYHCLRISVQLNLHEPQTASHLQPMLSIPKLSHKWNTMTQILGKTHQAKARPPLEDTCTPRNPILTLGSSICVEPYHTPRGRFLVNI